MNEATVTYANVLGEFLAPVLVAIRATGFFEAPVFMSLMLAAAIYLYVSLHKRLKAHNTLSDGFSSRYKRVLYFVGFSQCYLTTNAFAVALKTLIIEETDYETIPWFMAYVSPLHFYIVSVALAHIFLIWTNRVGILTKTLCLYIQVGLFGGYAIAAHRLLNEPFELTDPTTGFSGVFMIGWFGLINLDIAKRFLKSIPRAGNDRAKAEPTSGGLSYE